MRRAGTIVLSLLALSGAYASQPGRNSLIVRGQEQALYYFPSAGPKRATVLFAPGDGGWRGVAPEIAQTVASWGYDVYGFDTKRYLESFTPGGKPTLTETLIASDMAQIGNWVLGSGREPLLFLGWSEGAAMAAATGSTPAGKSRFGGVALVGLPETGVLGWKTTDMLATLARREPNEPSFRTGSLLSAISPLPVWMIYGEEDEYTSPERAKGLFANARDARMFVSVPGANHRFDGRRDQFYNYLKEGLTWLQSHSPSAPRQP